MGSRSYATPILLEILGRNEKPSITSIAIMLVL